MSRGTFQENVARRVEHERTARGWSLRTLADNLAHCGLEIDHSSLQKIEKGTRRVDVDELVAFATVFSTPVDDMMQPKSETIAYWLGVTYRNWVRAVSEAVRLKREYEFADARRRGLQNNLRRKLAEFPEATEALTALLAEEAAEAHPWQEGAGPSSVEDEERHVAEVLATLSEGVEELRKQWAMGADDE